MSGNNNFTSDALSELRNQLLSIKDTLAYKPDFEPKGSESQTVVSTDDDVTIDYQDTLSVEDSLQAIFNIYYLSNDLLSPNLFTVKSKAAELSTNFNHFGREWVPKIVDENTYAAGKALQAFLSRLLPDENANAQEEKERVNLIFSGVTGGSLLAKLVAPSTVLNQLKPMKRLLDARIKFYECVLSDEARNEVMKFWKFKTNKRSEYDKVFIKLSHEIEREIVELGEQSKKNNIVGFEETLSIINELEASVSRLNLANKQWIDNIPEDTPDTIELYEAHFMLKNLYMDDVGQVNAAKEKVHHTIEKGVSSGLEKAPLQVERIGSALHSDYEKGMEIVEELQKKIEAIKKRVEIFKSIEQFKKDNIESLPKLDGLKIKHPDEDSCLKEKINYYQQKIDELKECQEQYASVVKGLDDQAVSWRKSLSDDEGLKVKLTELYQALECPVEDLLLHYKQAQLRCKAQQFKEQIIIPLRQAHDFKDAASQEVSVDDRIAEYKDTLEQLSSSLEGYLQANKELDTRVKEWKEIYPDAWVGEESDALKNEINGRYQALKEVEKTVQTRLQGELACQFGRVDEKFRQLQAAKRNKVRADFSLIQGKEQVARLENKSQEQELQVSIKIKDIEAHQKEVKSELSVASLAKEHSHEKLLDAYRKEKSTSTIHDEAKKSLALAETNLAGIANKYPLGLEVSRGELLKEYELLHAWFQDYSLLDNAGQGLRELVRQVSRETVQKTLGLNPQHNLLKAYDAACKANKFYGINFTNLDNIFFADHANVSRSLVDVLQEKREELSGQLKEIHIGLKEIEEAKSALDEAAHDFEESCEAVKKAEALLRVKSEEVADLAEKGKLLKQQKTSLSARFTAYKEKSQTANEQFISTLEKAVEKAGEKLVKATFEHGFAMQWDAINELKKSYAETFSKPLEQIEACHIELKEEKIEGPVEKLASFKNIEEKLASLGVPGGLLRQLDNETQYFKKCRDALASLEKKFIAQFRLDFPDDYSKVEFPKDSTLGSSLQAIIAEKSISLPPLGQALKKLIGEFEGLKNPHKAVKEVDSCLLTLEQKRADAYQSIIDLRQAYEQLHNGSKEQEYNKLVLALEQLELNDGILTRYDELHDDFVIKAKQEIEQFKQQINLQITGKKPIPKESEQFVEGKVDEEDKEEIENIGEEIDTLEEPSKPSAHLALKIACYASLAMSGAAAIVAVTATALFLASLFGALSLAVAPLAVAAGVAASVSVAAGIGFFAAKKKSNTIEALEHSNDNEKFIK